MDWQKSSYDVYWYCFTIVGHFDYWPNSSINPTEKFPIVCVLTEKTKSESNGVQKVRVGPVSRRARMNSREARRKFKHGPTSANFETRGPISARSGLISKKGGLTFTGFRLPRAYRDFGPDFAAHVQVFARQLSWIIHAFCVWHVLNLKKCR